MKTVGLTGLAGAAKVVAMARRASFPLRAAPVPKGQPARPARALEGDYPTSWARSPAARVTRAALVEGIMRPLVAVLGSPQVRGDDRLADLEGPVVFAANHHSHVDTPTMLTAIPARWRHKTVVGAAADYFFSTSVSAALSALVIGAVPIERNKVGRKSADMVRELIDDGWSLLIFPEGGRSPDGWGQPFRGGAAYIAMRCAVPVIPVHIEGTGRVMAKGRSTPTRGNVTVTFGNPHSPRDGEDARKFAARIERSVAALADEVATDWWQASRRAHAGQTPGLGGPEVGAWRRSWSSTARDRHHQRSARRWPR